MKLDILIKNGRVLDVETGKEQIADIGVAGGRIVQAMDMQATQVIDATGCLVVPGLIDFHIHLFHGGSAMGISPDLLSAFGITAAVDPGSSGCANYGMFHTEIIAKSEQRIKSLLHVCSQGLPGYGLCEFPDPKMMRADKIKELTIKYADDIIGLKIRIGAECTGPSGATSLEAARNIAQELNLPLCVHVTNAALSTEEILSFLRSGDIFCHVYHGKGNSQILDSDDNVLDSVLRARERGVIFDAANGRNHFNTRIAKAAISQGFTPDIISTDAIYDTLCASPAVRDLPFIMSKYLNLGLPLVDVIRSVTVTPAKLMRMSGKIGTLREGAFADICIIKEKRKKVNFVDVDGQTITGEHLLVPQVTILNGRIAYSRTEFSL